MSISYLLKLREIVFVKKFTWKKLLDLNESKQIEYVKL